MRHFNSWYSGIDGLGRWLRPWRGKKRDFVSHCRWFKWPSRGMAWMGLFGITVVLCVMLGAPAVGLIPQTGGSQTVAQDVITPEVLLNQGRSLYESGDLTEALVPIQSAIEQYRVLQNPLGEAVALSNLALVQEQRGALAEAERAIAAGIALLTSADHNWGEASDATQRQSALAQSLNIQAQVQLSLGQAEAALPILEQATALFGELGNIVGMTRSQIRQAEALQSLGFHQAAIALLGPLYNQIQDQPTSTIAVAAIRNLATAYYQVGQLNQAEALMAESLQLASRLELPYGIAAAQLGLANILRAQAAIARIQGDSLTATAKTTAALELYGAIAQLESSSATGQLTQVQAQLNRLSLLIDVDQLTAAATEWPLIREELADLPPSRPGLYARMNLAKNLMRLQKAKRTLGARLMPTNPDLVDHASVENAGVEQELQQAIIEADAIGDRRAEAFALGYLGEWYENQYAITDDRSQWQQAQHFTQQALFLSTQINAPDLAYQWHWQMGRLQSFHLLIKDGSAQPEDQALLDEAIASYTSAIRILEGLRQDLVTVNRDVQFSFQENVEPIHRELVSLLLKKDDVFKITNNGLSDVSAIKQAQQTIESLQLVELTNFLREACVNLDRVAIEQVLTQTEAAVIYPIILRDRLEIIVSLPEQRAKQATKQYSTADGAVEADGQTASTLRRVSVPITQTDLESLMGRFYDGIYNFISIGYRPLAEQAYDILIRPIEADLAASPVDTLVFVLDGVLRNVPMGALNDGKQFLVEKYSIALTPGIQLLPNLLASNSLQDEHLSVAALGLSEGVQGFLPLPNVYNEIEQIKRVIPNTKTLLNQDFTAEGFANLISISPTPIVHLATHGQFSSQQENTFVLTWDKKINIGELSRALQTGSERRQVPIELLVLSACETASGDRRAALGLAGVAIRAGARSTVASLWQVDDAAAAEMMGEFYRQIASQKVSKAEALRQAQLAILNNPQYRKHPYYWAPFVLVGNWR